MPLIALLTATLSLAACKPAAYTRPQGDAARPVPASAARPPAGENAATAAHDNHNAVHWVQASAENPA
jgi:hypothetical protein